MTPSMIPTSPTIPIKTRRTLGVSSGDAIELGVACPRRGHDVALTECLRCDQCEGIYTAGPEGAAVACGERSPAPAPASVPLSAPPPSLGAAAWTPIADIMTRNVVCVREDLGLEAVATLLLDLGISGVPVVDGAGHPVGMVTKSDLVRAGFGPNALGEAAVDAVVADIMMPVAFSLPAGESIARAAALMAFEHVHRLPVVGASGEVIGLISPLDILRWLARGHGYVVGESRNDA